MLVRVAVALVLALAVTVTGCGGGDNGDDDEPQPSASASFPEGDLRIEIEMLDTGLLKGHAFADAADGWVVSAFSVTAQDEGAVVWHVVEPEVTGVGGPNVQEFFEVVLQELPRGEQITVEAIATLRDSSGAEVERRVVDNWPP
jgi:hypothetical protein